MIAVSFQFFGKSYLAMAVNPTSHFWLIFFYENKPEKQWKRTNFWYTSVINMHLQRKHQRDSTPKFMKQTGNETRSYRMSQNMSESVAVTTVKAIST